MPNLNYKEFLDRVFIKLTELQIDVGGLELDHLGYKVASDEEYNQLKPDFLSFSEYIREVMVNGRKVGVYKFNKPIVYKKYLISAIELIAPKEGETVVSGLEHVEFVLRESYQSFMLKYPKLDWDTSAMNRERFSMIKLKIDQNTQVKFHLKSILN